MVILFMTVPNNEALRNKIESLQYKVGNTAAVRETSKGNRFQELGLESISNT